jgi:hypothetical protein
VEKSVILVKKKWILIEQNFLKTYSITRQIIGFVGLVKEMKILIK